jgi:hypothetical protein
MTSEWFSTRNGSRNAPAEAAPPLIDIRNFIFVSSGHRWFSIPIPIPIVIPAGESSSKASFRQAKFPEILEAPSRSFSSGSGSESESAFHPGFSNSIPTLDSIGVGVQDLRQFLLSFVFDPDSDSDPDADFNNDRRSPPQGPRFRRGVKSAGKTEFFAPSRLRVRPIHPLDRTRFPDSGSELGFENHEAEP